MRAILTLVLAGALASVARAAEPTLSDITLIPIQDGVNKIDRFATDGRAATIVRGWRDNGNAHGHDVYLVLLPLKRDDGPANTDGVVAFEDRSSTLADITGVSPFDGERVLGALRFARATLNGRPATVVIRADLGEAAGGVLADRAPVDISVYELQSPGVEVGTTPDVFRLISKSRPKGRFCNADMALATALNLPLPADYAGGPAPSGCAK